MFGVRRGSWLVLLVGAAVGFGADAAAPAADPVEPGIRTVGIGFRGGQLTAEARLDPSPLPDVRQRLSSGLPTTSTWELRLYAARDFWFDRLKDERRYEVTATYRPLNSDWLVEKRLDGKLLETRNLPTLAETEDALFHLSPFVAFTMGDHLLGKSLVVKIRCTYASGIVLGVVPVAIDTGWARSKIFTWSGERP
jgi:hypothetical protein